MVEFRTLAIRHLVERVLEVLGTHIQSSVDVLVLRLLHASQVPRTAFVGLLSDPYAFIDLSLPLFEFVNPSRYLGMLPLFFQYLLT